MANSEAQNLDSLYVFGRKVMLRIKINFLRHKNLNAVNHWIRDLRGFWFSLNREAMPTTSLNQRGLSEVETRFWSNCISLHRPEFSQK